MGHLNAKRLTCSVLLSLCLSPAMADEVIDSINAFQNHVVTDSVTVQSYDTLNVSNVTVTSTGHLVLLASNGIVIPAGINVQLGGSLTVDIRRPYIVRFIYDSGGNMTHRRYAPQ